jgi:titin
LRFERLEPRTLLATLLVNTVSDSDNPAATTLSLREAIEVCTGMLPIGNLNATARLQVQGTLAAQNAIDFAIPGSGVQTLDPQSALPAVTVPIVIDGTSQPGFSGTPLVVLDGSQLTHVASGLDLEGGNSTVQGLAIDHFAGNGILLGGSGGDLIAGCFLGVDATGAAAAGNGADGVLARVDNVTIGGTAAEAGNVISANGGRGIEFRGTGTGDLVEGNNIGTGAAGATALGNQMEGIYVSGPSGVLVGGTSPGAGNLIAGNRADGVGLQSGGNLVEGNDIGVDATGAAALPNGGNGLTISSAGNTVGGTDSGAANVISGNALAGIVISASLATAQGNLVEGNLIGTDLTGTAAVSNGSYGVDIGTNTGGFNNTIGGTTAAARNVISGNKAGGVALGNAGSGNVVEGNAIGTDASGRKPLPNTGAGVFVGESAAGNTIGGTAPGAGNVIAGNQGDGIDLEATNALLIAGNSIGTDITGTTALPNTGNGVTADGARNATIGGTAAGSGNIISGNAGSGIVISGGGTYLDVVQGNLIGTDVTVTQNLGNGAHGIDIENTQGNTIGGTAAGAANTIAYSVQDGVRVSTGIDNLVSGNAIFASGGPGIDLVQGGNQTQPAPVLAFTPPASGSASGVLDVSLTAARSTTYTIEIFTNTALAAAGHEQGQSFVTSVALTTDAVGSGSVALFEPVNIYTATATDSNNNTSPFSNANGMARALVDLAVSAAVNSGPAAVGSDLNYTFTVANQGTGMATGVILSHMLPASVNFVSASASQGTADHSEGLVTANVGTILGGASATVEVDVIPQGIGSFALASRLIAEEGLTQPSQGGTSSPVDVHPKAPMNVAATVAAGTTPLRITWNFTNPPGKSATFRVYRSETPGAEGNLPYATGITSDQFTDTGQVPGHIYYYQVTALVGGLESPRSNETAGTILTAPTNVTVTPFLLPGQAGQVQAVIAWQYTIPATPGERFNIYRSETPGGEGNAPVFAGAMVNYGDLGIAPGHVYYYQVSATFGGALGPRSAEVRFAFPLPGAPVLAPPSTSLDPDSGLTRIALNWSDNDLPSNSVDSYRVYAGATPGGEAASPIASGPALTYSELLYPATTRYYQVSTVVDGVESPRSSEVKVVVPPLAAPVLSLAASSLNPSGEPRITLGWTDPEPGVMSTYYDGYGGTTSGIEVDNLGFAVNGAPAGNVTKPINLDPGQTVYFQVSAVVGTYVGPRSNVLPVTTPSLGAPGVGIDTHRNSEGNYPVEFSWNNPDGDAAPNLAFNIYVSSTSGGEGAMPTVSHTQSLVYDTTLVPGASAYIQVSAVIGGYEGPRSKEMSFTAPGGVPVNFNSIHVQTLKSRATDLVLSVSGALNQADAQNLAAYHLVTLGKLNKKTGRHVTKPVKVTSAVYNAATNTVTLAVKGKLPNQPLELSINTSAVLDASGQPIAGTSGQSGGTFQTTFGKKGITL